MLPLLVALWRQATSSFFKVNFNENICLCYWLLFNEHSIDATWFIVDMTQNLAVLLDLILSGLNFYKGICLFFDFKFFETIGLLFTKFSNNMTLSEIAMVKFFICFDWPSYCTCVIFIHVFFTFWYCNDTWLIS